MKVVQMASPNFNTRPVGTVIDTVVLHADASGSARGSAIWCCTPKAKNPNPVSYHAIGERDGTLYALVASELRAWHAGHSAFAGRANVNDFSIGYCFSNRQDGKEPFTSEQLETGALVIAGWMARYPAITLARIVTHEAVATPKGRKHDPGPLFPLEQFRALVAQTAGLSLGTGA